MQATIDDPSRPIPRRRLDLEFDPQAIPRDFYDGDEVLTLVLAALSLVFPDGERFFVESVMRYKDRITDPALLDAMRGFAAQEGMHSKEHLAFNAMLKAQGLESFELLERQVRALLERPKKYRTARDRLAITCALEHFTAILAEQMLTDDEHRDRFHESVRPLWVWHALEESEHKAVAFDVYQQIDGSYARRALVMATTTAFFMGFVTYAHARLLAERGRLRDVPALARAWGYLWLRPGIFRRLIPAYLDYYRPGFHPDQRDTTRLLADWRERLFGERGTLRRALDAARAREGAAAGA